MNNDFDVSMPADAQCHILQVILEKDLECPEIQKPLWTCDKEDGTCSTWDNPGQPKVSYEECLTVCQPELIFLK